MNTLGDCQNNSGLRRASGFCPTSQDFIDLVNESCERALRRGDFHGTVVPMFCCIFNGCVVWPRYVLEVRRLNICNHAMPPRSLWYDFLPTNQHHWHHWRGGPLGFRQDGETPVLQNVQGDGRLIRAYPRSNNDVGKTVTIFGTDNNGQPLATYDAGNNFIQWGQVITLAKPFGSTNTYVRYIDYVTKDETEQIVDVYAYNATTNLLEEIAHYEPTETTPTYSRYKLTGPFLNLPGGAGLPNCCNNPRGVLALVKLRYIEAKVPTDLVFIENMAALKKWIQSLKAEDANDIQLAKAFEADAVHELNRQLEDHQPDDQFPVDDQTVGPVTFTNQAF